MPLAPPLSLPMLLPVAVCTYVQVCRFAWPQRKHDISSSTWMDADTLIMLEYSLSTLYQYQ